MVLLKECLLCLKKSYPKRIRFFSDKIRESTYVGIVDAPVEEGQKKRGVSKAPQVLREAGLIQKLKEDCNVSVKDYGAIGFDGNIKSSSKKLPENMLNYERVVGYNKNLSEIVQKVINDGRICLTLGGDHSIGLGSVSGHCKAKGGENTALIWVDAHADINTNKTSDSGNIHGMPVALLAQDLIPYWSNLPFMDWHHSLLPLKNIAYIGLRSIDPYEEFLIQKMGIVCYDIYDVQKYGIDSVINESLRKIDPDGTKSIHLSFDIDALDPSDAPSTGTPVDGGLLLREGIYIASTIHKTGRLGAMDLVEVNPTLGDEEDVQKTINSALQVIAAAFGYGRRGLKPGLEDLKQVRF
ncbi:arginase-1-like [Onthophagus taurus]|uniref:arginase-1-like n=1 Tax=Onthophagus taurus TaxID=166361 RepID=UPI0039BDD3F8